MTGWTVAVPSEILALREDRSAAAAQDCRCHDHLVSPSLTYSLSQRLTMGSMDMNLLGKCI